MDFQFLVMEKSWKVIVEKEWAPCVELSVSLQVGTYLACVIVLSRGQ